MRSHALSDAERLTREDLLRLVYELLDAHDDTARLAAELMENVDWTLHLRYLQDLQRVGREMLASAATTELDTAWESGPLQVERSLRLVSARRN